MSYGKALKDVTKEKILLSMWMKLKSLYMTKSLSHRLCWKQQLYSFRVTRSRMMVE